MASAKKGVAKFETADITLVEVNYANIAVPFTDKDNNGVLLQQISPSPGIYKPNGLKAFLDPTGVPNMYDLVTVYDVKPNSLNPVTQLYCPYAQPNHRGGSSIQASWTEQLKKMQGDSKESIV
jgi:hypothetical protein